MIKNILFIFSFFISWQALGQTAIDKGQEAPEDGVFYTNAQAAKLIADREAAKERSKVQLDSQKQELNAVCEGEKNIKDLYLKMEKERSQLLSDLKDKQIENLYGELQKESQDYSIFWFVGGATIGAVASITIFFAATQIDKMPTLISSN